MATRIPPIREFPNDGRRWRIDWLGPVRGNPGSSSEPTIDVIFSPVRDGVSVPHDSNDVLDDERTARHIGIGQLPFLTVGSLWKDKRILKSTSGQRVTLRDVTISNDTISEILTSNKEEGDWTIPAWLHSVARTKVAQGFQTPCLAVALGDDPYGIIIPMPEIIRFYYACSTRLAHAAFSGAYQHDLPSIINPSISGFLKGEDKYLVIRLRRWVYNDDAWTLGRIVFDPVALNGARMIHDSLLKAVASGKIAYPRSTFPFSGKVNWTFRGLSFKHKDHERYLVFELIRCSSPFPYDELEVTRDNDGQAPEDNTIPDEERKPSWAGPRNIRLDQTDAELQSQEDPQADTKSHKITLTTDRFDALDGKDILYNPKIESKYKAADLVFPPIHVADQFGTGQGTYADNTTAPAAVVTSHTKRRPLPASLENIDEIAAALNEYDDVTATVIPPHGEIHLPLLAPPDRARWTYLDSRKRTRRRVRAIRITYRDVAYCFLEFEQRKSEKKTAGIFWSSRSSIFSRSDFQNALLALSKAEGKWEQKEFQKASLQCRKMKHTWPSISACAASIYNIIKQRTFVEEK